MSYTGISKSNTEFRFRCWTFQEISAWAARCFKHHSIKISFAVEKSGSERNKQALNKFLSPLEILPYDEKAIWHYAELRQELQSTGKTIGSLDMLIAAPALAMDVVLVTNNTKEFERIEGLKLENWV